MAGGGRSAQRPTLQRPLGQCAGGALDGRAHLPEGRRSRQRDRRSDGGEIRAGRADARQGRAIRRGRHPRARAAGPAVRARRGDDAVDGPLLRLHRRRHRRSRAAGDGGGGEIPQARFDQGQPAPPAAGASHVGRRFSRRELRRERPGRANLHRGRPLRLAPLHPLQPRRQAAAGDRLDLAQAIRDRRRAGDGDQLPVLRPYAPARGPGGRDAAADRLRRLWRRPPMARHRHPQPDRRGPAARRPASRSNCRRWPEP